MSQINERIEKLEDIKNERNLLEEKRKQMEKELNDEKNEMESRMNKIMKNDDGLSRDEILNYVINDIKPNIANKSKTPISRIKKEKENKYKNNNYSNKLSDNDYNNEKFEEIKDKNNSHIFSLNYNYDIHNFGNIITDSMLEDMPDDEYVNNYDFSQDEFDEEVFEEDF